jgi:hypothetical protein
MENTMASEAASRSIRIRASHIRQRLLSRNNTPFFRNTLAELSDEELVEREERHHKEKLDWLSRQVRERKSVSGRVIS